MDTPMTPDEQPKPNYIRRTFMHKKFFHYTWIGVVISALNVLFLWLLIDIAHIPTVISSIMVVVGNFVLRYVLMDIFGVVG